MELQAYINLVNLAIVLSLPVIGFLCGTIAERRHYASIREREKQWLQKPLLTNSTSLDDSKIIVKSELAVGSVVISIDYFKRFLAQLRMFFGGELGAYSSLIDRGKREAILRLRESHPNADAYINVRLQTASLSRGEHKTLGSVEVIAYGTAVTFENDLRSEGT